MGLGIKTKAVSLMESARWRVGAIGQKLRPALGLAGARVNASFQSPTDMCDTDRIYIYALVRGLRPKRALEIGTRWGGSARIITAAMQDNGVGKLVGLDPATGSFRASNRATHGRFTLVEGRSPEDVGKAMAHHDGLLDFAFVDALHTYHSCAADLHVLAPHMAPGGHILFHDAFHPGIRAAADEFVASRDDVTDLGMVTRSPSVNTPVCNQGFRLLRIGDNTDEMVRESYQRMGVAYPDRPERYHNFDKFAIRIGLVEESGDGYRWKDEENS